MTMNSNASPWAGLATNLATPADTVADAMNRAKLSGWGVQLQRLYLGNGQPTESYATVRSDNGRILGHGHTDGYRVVQNEDALAPFDAFLRSGAATVETAGSFKGGAKVWLLAKVNRPDVSVVPRADDRVAKYILAATSHDGSISLQFLPTMIRVVCQNTLAAAIAKGRGSALRIKHTRSAGAALEAVKAAIDKFDADVEETAKLWRALAGVNVSAAQVKAYIDAVFPPAPVKASAPSETLELDELIGAPIAAAKADFASLLNRPLRTLATSEAPSDVIAYQSGAATAAANRRVQDNVLEILERGGRGLDMPGVKGTGWGAYNAVTEYLTWERGRSNDNRMQAVWFGDVGKRALSAAVDTFLTK